MACAQRLNTKLTRRCCSHLIGEVDQHTYFIRDFKCVQIVFHSGEFWSGDTMEKAAKSTISFKEEDLTADDINVSLIRCVKDIRYLYSKTDKRYCDRNLTETTWARIGLKLGMTKEEAKVRWTRLRNNYCKVIARRRVAKRPSVFGESPVVKPWIYETDMSFLREHISFQARKMSLENVASESASRSPSPIPSVSDTQSSHGHEYAPASAPEHNNNAQDYSSYAVAPEFHPQPAALSASGPIPISLVQSQTHDSQAHCPGKRQRLDEIQDTLLKYIRTLEGEKEEPLIGWFKTLLPSLKILSPARLAQFQIHTMQEMLKLVAEEGGHQNHSSSS